MASIVLAGLLALLLLPASPNGGERFGRVSFASGSHWRVHAGARSHRRWNPSVPGARRYARARLGDVSFAIVGLHSRLRSFRGARTAPAASVIKAMLLVAYLRQRSVRGRRLHADEKALLEPMIRVSDNAAGIQVAALLGSIVSWQRWGIADVRPRGWRLYFKGGWGIADDGVGTVSHQVAFLQRGRCRLALAILTEHNPSTAYGNETLRGVARRLLHGIRAAPCGRRRAVRPQLGRGLDLGEKRGNALDLLAAGTRTELG
jgi:hypothetical protein